MSFFIVSSLSLLVVCVTMLARANDLRWKPGLHWNTRLIGFVLAGFAPVGVVMHEATTGLYPNVYETLFRVGLMLVFVTTPYLPPWWKWISGKDSGSTIVHSDDRRQQK